MRNRLRDALGKWKIGLVESSQSVAAHAIGNSRFRHRRDEIDRMKFLLVLAHPRSGSTLLTHILMSHPEIIGYGENHCSYETEEDLEELLFRNAYRTHDYSLKQSYALDKIVWTRHEISPSVLKNPRLYFVLIVRDPEPTIASMKKLLPSLHEEDTCLNRYRECLHWLLDCLRTINDPDRCFVVHYEELIERSDAILSRLQDFLRLDQPLSSSYTVYDHTGRLRYGDRSENIRSGQIQKRVPIAVPEVDPAIAARGREALKQFTEASEHYCSGSVTA